MGAARFIGRVGGLAVALGVGVAVSSGHGVAFADVGDSGAADSARSGSPADSAGSPSAAERAPPVRRVERLPAGARVMAAAAARAAPMARRLDAHQPRCGARRRSHCPIQRQGSAGIDHRPAAVRRRPGFGQR